MKTLKMNFLLVLVLTGITMIANGQASGEWQMLLNNDHSPFKIKMINNEMTFNFNPASDTLTFSLTSKKEIKGGYNIQVALRNNNKAFYTSSDKNLNAAKTEIVIPMADVSQALKTIKVPSKPKYVISVMDRTVARVKLYFEFSDK